MGAGIQVFWDRRSVSHRISVATQPGATLGPRRGQRPRAIRVSRGARTLSGLGWRRDARQGGSQCLI